MTTTPQSRVERRVRPRILAGDRFYAIARWGIVALLLASADVLTPAPLWPPLGSGDLTVLLIWSYVLLAVAVPILLFALPEGRVVRFTFIIDIAIITLLTSIHGDARDTFYPLYLLPLLGAAFRFSPAASLLIGLITAAGYLIAYLARAGGADLTRDAVGLVGLVLRVVTMIILPWMAAVLNERWATTNRARVVLAEDKEKLALEEANAYRDQMRALYEVAYSLATTANYQNVLDVALVESRKLVPHTVGAVLLSTGDADELFVAAAHGLNEQDSSQVLRVSRGSLGRALRIAETLLIPDIAVEPELAPLTALRDCRSAVVVPLRSGINTYGVMIFADARSTPFSQDEIGKFSALASYALVALQNAQLIFDLRQERTKLLSKEEEVRHQLARDLHDGPAQALAAIAMNVEFIKRLHERDPVRVIPELDKLAALAKRTTHEVRTMLFELRPLALETQGLDVTLQQYLERFQDRADGVQIVLETGNVTAELDTKTEGTLFNIIQESINNALKHAQAQHIWVRLNQTSSAVEVVIQDDGRGFDITKVKETYEKRGSFGLLNIEERASLIGGVSEMTSSPGAGTTVRIVVPIAQ